MTNTLTTAILSILWVSLCGCGGRSQSHGQTPSTAPAIARFAGPASTGYGQLASLSWTMTGGAPTSLTLQTSAVDPRTEAPWAPLNLLAASSSATVSPRNRQTVSLTAANDLGSSTRTLTLAAVGVDLLTPFQWTPLSNAGLSVDAAGCAYLSSGSDPMPIYRVDGSGVVATFVPYAGSNCTTTFINPATGQMYGVMEDGIYAVDGLGNLSLWLAGSFGQAACSRAGNLYACGFPGDDSVYRITPEKVKTVLASRAQGIYGPWGIAVDARENVYVSNCVYSRLTETVNGITHVVGMVPADTISRIAADGTVTTLAGVLQAAGYQDGPAAQARFNLVLGLALNVEGTVLYVADGNNALVRALDLATLTVTTVAGSPWAGLALPIAPHPNQAQLPGPLGLNNAAIGFPVAVAMTPAGDLLVATLRTPWPAGVDQAGQLYQITLGP